MNNNVVKAIEAANYRPTDVQVEQLAFTVTLGLNSRGTYLRVLAAAVVDANVTKRGQLGALNKAHAHFYPHVLAGVGGNSLDSKERERRGTFARTSLSTLRGFVRSGGDVRALDLATLTKASLRKATAPVEAADRAERSMSRANATLLRAARRLARRDPGRARELIRHALEALKVAMPAANAKPEPVKVRTPRVARVPAGTAAAQPAGVH
jgi:hypothetical protein